MSQVETLPAVNPIDFSLSASQVCQRNEESNLNWPAASSPLINDVSASQCLRMPNNSYNGESHDSSGDVIFPSLPPLHQGHPDIHMRNGVMASFAAAADHEPDAEKAFFVADLSQVYRQHQRWITCLPEIQPFYAVKCNPDPYVIRLLAALGAGFDCASLNEISSVLNVGGIDPSRIIFANPCKAVSFIRNASRMGVDTMTFDNADELYKVARSHPKAKLVVRILTDDSKSLCAFGIKFGAPLNVVPSLLAKAKELNLDVVGVSFHVGSGCYDPSVYTDAIMRSRTVFDMAKEAGYDFTLLDIGGGFEDALFEKAATVLREAIDRYFPDRKHIKMIAEPGRFYVSTAFKLAAHIIARRAPLEKDAAPATSGTAEEPDQPKVMYYINDGVYGAFNCILFDHQVIHPYVLSMGGSFHVAESEPKHVSSVWGPTCDSIDCVSPKTVLPVNLQVGDWLGFNNMGAYTVCAASQFNGFAVSNVIYTAGVAHANEVRMALKAFAAEGHGL
ncbi:ornithine decarboxylase [Coprinopsis cinerea okayama7|uniref:ornithine decarboxylase n=1 Tax=Coprinopsis cinerea (strain Okayama-7 / 130 / ATCC MYA-4618 / FGSC 9003) TaxID=240176 RepID=A8NVH4_COPC7|nr:ornithine decarboxylase [Coprinopsis cinerea okayama7\|eukprot:XP_001836715.1 ornithine decarboxylase [Coprinopsis cinerea okayama7\